MAASLLDLDFGLAGSLRRMPGIVPKTGGLEALSLVAGNVWYGKDQGSFAEEVLFSNPPQWWGSRPRKPTQRHPDFKLRPDNWQKPGRVDSQLAAWDLGLKRPPDYVCTPVQGQGANAVRKDHLEVGMCSKLCEDGRITDSVDALNYLVHRGRHVPKNLFYSFLKRCIAQKDLELGRRIHALTVESGYEGDAFLATHLIGLYASHRRLEEAMRVFAKVSTPSQYNWSAIIFAYARHGEAQQAIRLYRQMRELTIKPASRIYVAVLKACTSAGDLTAGKEVHDHILASPGKPDKFVQTSLVDMYAKCGSLEDARRVFDRLPERDVITWNAMLAGYAQQGKGEQALSLYNSMRQEGLSSPDSVTFLCLLQACASVGVSALQQGKQLHLQIEERGLQDDVVLGGSLVNMYAKCGSLEDARSVFDRLPHRNVVTWTAMLAGYAQNGMGQEALSLYYRMQQEGISPPDYVTFVCILQACTSVAALPLGQQLHAHIKDRGLQADLIVGTALVNMYAKCGSMSDAQQVFDSLPERTIEAWGALAAGYTCHGDSDVVFGLLDRMRQEGVQPNDIMFLSVLTVCSHVGLLDKGREYFEAMTADYGISPTIEHYACMMDLLGRAGHLDEALQMAKSMPFPPNGAVWRTLLGACRKWNNVEIGQQAFELAMNVDAKDASSYVLMSNIYANTQMEEEAKEMEARRVKSGAWKKPGQSWWTDMDGLVHTFLVGGQEAS